MIVEIILQQRTGEALRIGSLAGVAVGDRVRVDGDDAWVVVRCLLPKRMGAPRRLVCERQPSAQRRAA